MLKSDLVFFEINLSIEVTLVLIISTSSLCIQVSLYYRADDYYSWEETLGVSSGTDTVPEPWVVGDSTLYGEGFLI